MNLLTFSSRNTQTDTDAQLNEALISAGFFFAKSAGRQRPCLSAPVERAACRVVARRAKPEARGRLLILQDQKLIPIHWITPAKQIREEPRIFLTFCHQQSLIISNLKICSNTENQVLRATARKIGCAVFICRGMMEYWSDGILKTRVWRNYICFYLNGTVPKIKSDHNPILIRHIQNSIVPPFHYSMGSLTAGRPPG